MSCRVAVERWRYAAGMADAQGWQFEILQTTQELRMRIKYVRKLSFFIMWMLHVQLSGRTEQIRACVSRYDQSAWTAN